MTNDPRNLRHLQGMAPQAHAPAHRKAPSGDLLAWSGLDFLASAFGMWAAFASRTVRRGGEIRLADLGIGKGVK
jgi:predicted hotdog family 3-hydroxylacyl-ACP dehydratase